MVLKNPRRKRRISKKQLGILIAIVIVIALWMGRGIIRDTIVRKYASVTYGRQVKTVFANEFNPVNYQALVLLDLDPGPAKDVFNNSSDACSVAYFEFFRETVVCNELYEARKSETPDMLLQWKKNSPAFNEYLLAHGWKYDNGPYRTAPDELFTKGYTTSTGYIKQVGKIECQVELYYLNLNEPGRPETENYVSLYGTCQRQVKFFGGSYNLYSGGWRNLFRG